MKHHYEFAGPNGLDRGVVERNRHTLTIREHQSTTCAPSVCLYLESLPSLIEALEELRRDWLEEDRSE